MDGLVTGRIVYFVFDSYGADEVNRRRTTGSSIAQRIKAQVPGALGGTVPQWPLGAQAHIGNDVAAGDICPAMVVAIFSDDGTRVNLKVMLDGSDTYWATSVPFDGAPTPFPRTWHWMFDGQQKRYDPTAAKQAQGGA